MGSSHTALFPARTAYSFSFRELSETRKHFRRFCEVLIHIFGITAINHELEFLEAGNEYCQRKI